MGHRYIGSKTQILNEILDRIGKIIPSGGNIVDLMSGTAVVSSALRNQGYKVTAVDIMTYSYHHARVALNISSVPPFNNARTFIEKYGQNLSKNSNNYNRMIEALNSIPEREGYFWNEFSLEGTPQNASKSRNYFSSENAKKIDGIRFWIKKLYRKKNITAIEHSLLLHDLVMATNDVANISGTYGHYLSKLVGRATSAIQLKPMSTINKKNPHNHKVLQGYAENLAKSLSCDLCYIDPPYMKRQYAANYHILETIAREDNPEAIGESGLRPWRDQYSNFCTKTKVRQSFKKIINDMDCSHFLISYSEDGLLTLEDLKDLFSSLGSIKIYSFGHSRFRSNKSKLNKILKEYLIYIKK